MNDIGIGKIIECERGRDAIHIAVAPVTASEKLAPGQDIGMTGPDMAGRSKTPIGIVDPYLKRNVLPGQRFYIFLYPGTITSLRHEWVHPAFGGAEPSPTDASRKWIEAFAVELDQTYHRLMEAARQWVEYEDYTYDNSETYKNVEYDKWAIFWGHYEIVTGTKVEREKTSFFTCSC